MNVPYVILYVLILFLLRKHEAKTLTAHPETRIIGGQDAFAGQFPYAAAIHVQTSDSKFFCGGTILNQQWILTSGHCVYNAVLFTIQLGSNYLNTSDPNRETLATSDWVVHPDFNPDTIENDIGLIKLRMPITFNDYIKLIYMANVALGGGTSLTIIGWGQTSDSDPELSESLQYQTVSTLTNAECKIYYGNQISDNMICVQGNYNEGTCIGDNGSPLLLPSSMWVFGVASFISGNGCESTEPSGFTRILPYVSWIDNITRVS
jgi:secreted trypsin-like serine protease